ncbi:ribulokinase [Arthrobacter crystallopoietes BAB-32]|uniref:Ribulokinase n=1 Tax=Arthrobacter crystallopoietes BAB-32 TaxID=1246476 RepID=N1V2H0_9MICC|nr:ribulokinase [Arthrobacter crystallopoietes]EMY35545.1 ribulokinase [Arthrobacter crystallopoietes BAB-32]
MSHPKENEYVIGVDFGTLSGRALVVRVSDGREMGSAVHPYPHAVITSALTSDLTGNEPVRLPVDWALQVPQDYREVLQQAVPQAIAAAGIVPDTVVGIAVDFTACTMIPTLNDGTPLCEVDGLLAEPHAYAKLWRHHAAQAQADRINELACSRNEPWLARYGGLISSEWEFAKALQLLEEAPQVYAQLERWVEAADWIVWELCGEYVRNACTAGYKGMLQDGHYPSSDFCAELNPDFATFVEDKLDQPIGQLAGRAGTLTSEAAEWTGLREGIAVAVGNVDAHVTAPAARAVAPGQMVAIMGTSTCHVMNGAAVLEVPGMCGAVEGGIVSGLWGYEAGQSGVGDIFAWFVENIVPRSYYDAAESAGLTIHEHLTELAKDQEVGQHGLIALDWHSGNRSVLVDHELSSVIVGQTLATRPEDVYRALLEATAFGARTIVEAFNNSDVPVKEFIAAGGLIRNSFLMQVYADILNMPVRTIGSTQGPALGSAIHAAVAAGAYPDIHAASEAMGAAAGIVYEPIPYNVARYEELFAEYTALHDYFGRGANTVMHRLKRFQRNAMERAAQPVGAGIILTN